MRPLGLAALVVAALAAVPPAGAKAPLGATVDGPGLERPLVFPTWHPHAPGLADAPVLDFAEAAGLEPAVFEESPRPMLDTKPHGDLGPRFTATYDLGPGYGDERVLLVQDVYPYAAPRGVTFMAPGQRLYGGATTRGGWFAPPPGARSLLDVLGAAGLPGTPPSDGGEPLPRTAGLAAALMLGLGALALAVGRRRPHAA